MRERSFCLLFLLLINLASGAAQYYVSPTGSDSHSGALSQPWLTGQHAQGVVRPGDVVYFRGGVYTNGISISTTSGTSNAPITYTAYPGEKPIIHLPLDGPRCIIVSTSWNVIDGFALTGGENGVYFYFSTNSIVQNCYASGILGHAFIAVHSPGSTIRNCGAYNLPLNNWPRTNSSWAGGIAVAQGSDNSLIENCFAYFIHGEGILVGSANNSTIRNCICADTWAAGYYLNGDNNLAIGNIGLCSQANADLNFSIRHLIRIPNSVGAVTEGQEFDTNYLHGLRGTRIINNLIIQFQGAFGVEMYWYPTNYNVSDCLFANNTCVGTFGSGSAWSLNMHASGNFGNWPGGNFHILNNLYLTLNPSGLVYCENPAIDLTKYDIGNNIYVFESDKSSPSLWWGTNQFYYAQAGNSITNYWAVSPEKNFGPTASTWISDTNQAASIIPNVYSLAQNTPRFWQTNGGPPPDLDISWVFTNLATCSNTIVALREKLSAPFRPIKSTNNVALHAGRQFPDWTWVDDFGVTNTMTAPIATDLMGYLRSGNPTIGALEPWLRSPSALNVLPSSGLASSNGGK